MELNTVMIAGNLTRDPEIRTTSTGTTVCKLGLANNRRYQKKGEEETKEETCFVDITVWGRQAEVCNEYLSKGRAVVVEGRLKLDQWEDQGGNQRSKLSVVADRVHFMPRTGEGNVERSAGAITDDETPF